MKLKRNLYIGLTTVVAGSLCLQSLVELTGLGIGAGWCFVAIMLICSTVGAVGVIWLGWHWLKLAGTITSIAKRLKKETAKCSALSDECGTGAGGIGNLTEAVDGYFDVYHSYTATLEKQVEELQVQIQLSQRQRRNTEAIIYSIRDAVFVIDEFDRLLMANEATGRVFNFNFKNSLHKPINELIASDDDIWREFVEFLSQSRQSKVQGARREIEFSEKGELKIYDCVVSCVYDDRKQVCGVVAVLHDITHEKEVSKMKDDFVSHVSHELKTPLASITAYSEMLLDGEADNEQTREEFYSVIQSQAQRLNRLIEDILNTSRIESGLVKIEKEPVSLTLLIEEQMPMLKKYAEDKNIALTWGNAEQKPIVFDQVYVDKDMIRQVIVNLLSNAVKYTPASGSVKIETEVDEITNQARVSITDTGVGIDSDNIEHVFDKFYRVKANNKQAKGTGLGLSLVKQIIEKVHGGRVFVKSQVGVGSTFGFELGLSREMASAVNR